MLVDRRCRDNLAPALKTFSKIQLLLTLACVFSEVYARYILHLSGIYIYPLLDRDALYDFALFRPAFRHFHSPQFFDTVFPFMYPAPVGVIFQMFFLSPSPLIIFLLFIVASFLSGAVLLARALRQRRVDENSVSALIAVALLLSFPLWFEVKQANIEICVAVIAALGVWAFFKTHEYTAAACFGIAGAMKIFPFVYLGLLLSRRMYRQAAFAVCVAAMVTVASLWLLGGDIVPTWHHVQDGVDQFKTVYMLHFRVDEIGFDHSLFALYKRALPGMRAPELLRPARAYTSRSPRSPV